MGRKNEPCDDLTELLNGDDAPLLLPENEEVEDKKNTKPSKKGKSTKIKKKEKKKKEFFIPES